MSHKKHPLYWTWQNMRRRCSAYAKPADRKNYYARGIRVCFRWRSFQNFISDMGPRPTPLHTVERIDTDGNYDPGNCKWATPAEQSLNRKAVIRVNYLGKEVPLIEVARSLGILPITFWRRWKAHGLERAIAMGQPRNRAIDAHLAAMRTGEG